MSLACVCRSLGLFVDTSAEAVFSCLTAENYIYLPERPAFPSESNTGLPKYEAGCQHRTITAVFLLNNVVIRY
jgi:hypothetical protein